MKSSFLKFVLFVCCFSFLAVSTYAEDWSKVRKTIEEMNNKMEKAMINGEVDQMVNFYVSDAISLPNFEPEMRGLSKIKEKAKKDMDAGFKITAAEFTTTDVIGSGDIAVEIGKWDMTANVPNMDKPWSDTGKYLTVWQKQADGSWKVKADTWNSNSYPKGESGMATETE